MTESTNPQQQRSRALDVPTGRITCGSVGQRRLYEQVGVEDRVEFVGDALDAGRQAEAGEYDDEPVESEVEAPRGPVDDEVRELVENAQEDDSDE